MKIKVLQGLNLKNPYTTVVAEMDTVKPELLDFFRKLHPVFMIDYAIISSKTLEIQTHIPFLWKKPEMLQPLEDYSTGKKELEDAKTEMLEMVSLIVKSMSSIPILSAAHKMGYETNQFYTNNKILSKKLLNRYFNIGIGHEAGVTVAASSTADSVLAFKTQRDKWFTNQFIESMGIPIAAWEHVESREDLPEIAKRIGFPCVIKPVGLTGGHAVFVGIKDLKELEEAYDKIKEAVAEKPALSLWQAEIIVQKKIEGNDYRVLVVNGKVEIATHRIPARVIGDGKHTIKELIEIENKNPARNTSLPTHTLKYIVIDDELIKVVRSNGHELDDVLKKDEIVYVRRVASMSQGGITADMTDKIHPQTKLICESIGKSIHCNVLGVDVLCKDITKSLTPDNGCIIEMNTMPETYLNAFPVIGKQYPDIGEKIIQGTINTKAHTNRVVVIGNIKDINPEQAYDEIANLPQKPQCTGKLSEGKLIIDSYEINSQITSIEDAVLALKKNRLLDTIVLHYKDSPEVEENGLGFDTVDLLLISKQEFEKIGKTLDQYTKDGKITKLVQI